MIAEHRLTVVGKCPVQDCPDVYQCTVRTSRLILVEDILAAVKRNTAEPCTQEDLTCRIAKDIGGGVRVETVGVHSGVTTTVVEERP